MQKWAQYGMCQVWTWQKKKRWQEYTEELYKEDLQDPDNHDGVITHLGIDVVAETPILWPPDAES